MLGLLFVSLGILHNDAYALTTLEACVIWVNVDQRLANTYVIAPLLANVGPILHAIWVGNMRVSTLNGISRSVTCICVYTFDIIMY